MVCCEGWIHYTHLSSFTHPRTSSRWCDSLLWKREPPGWFLTAPLRTHCTHNIGLLPTNKENIRQQQPRESYQSSHQYPGTRGFHFVGFSSLLFADAVALSVASSSHWTLAAECEATETRIGTSKSEATVLSKKRVKCLFWVRKELLPQLEEFKYFWVFTRARREEWEMTEGLMQR